MNMTFPPNITKISERPRGIFISYSRGDDFDKAIQAHGAIEALLSVRGHRQVAPPRHPPPDGLKTAAQAAAKLGCSIKTLNAHVSSGALKYVAIGHGKKRLRKMFADADLNEFITNQTRKESPCLSDATHARRSTRTTSKSTVVAFSDLRRRPPGGKRKP
jgi:hypothetical protein